MSKYRDFSTKMVICCTHIDKTNLRNEIKYKGFSSLCNLHLFDITKWSLLHISLFQWIVMSKFKQPTFYKLGMFLRIVCSFTIISVTEEWNSVMENVLTVMMTASKDCSFKCLSKSGAYEMDQFFNWGSWLQGQDNSRTLVCRLSLSLPTSSHSASVSVYKRDKYLLKKDTANWKSETHRNLIFWNVVTIFQS